MKPMCCGFSKAWIGRCQQEVTGAHGMCFEHGKLKCVSCGAQATHDCDETGQFVCGAPLCADCEHTTAPDGSNGGIGFNAQRLPDGMRQHVKKTEQRFRDFQESEARFAKVMPVVALWRKKPPRGKAEVIDCPACGGRLHLSQASVNGHVHGHCQTEGCVSWME